VLKTKVSIWLVMLALLVGVATSGYMSLTALSDVLWAEKRQQIKSQVDQAASIVTYYQHLVETHQLTLDEAQRRAADVVRSLRYSKEGYFWINDLDHKLIVHPFRLGLEGKSMLNFQDKEGVYVYREFVTVAQSAQAAGYLLYYRARPGFESRDQQIPKLSYVKRVDGWDWVVGTGVYVDDIEKIYTQQLNNQLSLWVMLLLALTLMGFVAALVWRPDSSIKD
jgi:methyl-accepting chemotaxis protein